MNWAEHCDTWPNAAASTFVDSKPHRWHLQRAGAGSKILLIHGAGGSTHSWRDVFVLLSEDHDVLALDLPGQGFTKQGSKQRLGLKTMAEDITNLLKTLEFTPDAIIGHSAGAAIMFRMALDWDALARTKLISINGALGNFEGLAGVIFPAMAKLLASNPVTARLFSKAASSERSVARLIASTGSKIDAAGLSQYRMLVSSSDHVDATLGMMAQWSLDKLNDDLRYIKQDTVFLVGERDSTVPPRVSVNAAQHMPNARVERFSGLGHLLHEEAPAKTRDAISTFLS